jgi:hypothetical protein
MAAIVPEPESNCLVSDLCTHLGPIPLCQEDIAKAMRRPRLPGQIHGRQQPTEMVKVGLAESCASCAGTRRRVADVRQCS